jgi:hypothetical protein
LMKGTTEPRRKKEPSRQTNPQFPSQVTAVHSSLLGVQPLLAGSR